MRTSSVSKRDDRGDVAVLDGAGQPFDDVVLEG